MADDADSAGSLISSEIHGEIPAIDDIADEAPKASADTAGQELHFSTQILVHRFPVRSQRAQVCLHALFFVELVCSIARVASGIVHVV